ncbi:hypothetical protein D3C73_1166780 [compost metagenome]
MENGIEVTVVEQRIERMRISDIQLDPFDIRSGGHGIRYHHFMPGGQQVLDHV